MGVVRPPLRVAESDGTPSVRPVNVIAFDSSDFTVTDQGGATVRINVNPGGGTSLTDTYIGFGDSSNLLTGSANFTFVDETGGSGPTVLLTGDKPTLKIQDDTDATDYRTEFQQSGASLFTFAKNTAGGSVEMLRMDATYFAFQRGGSPNVGIGTVPSSGVALHIKDDESDNDNVVVRIQDSSVNTVGDQVAIEGYWSTAQAGVIYFELRDTGTAASAIVMEASNDAGSLTEFVRLDGNAKAITFNEQSEDIDFRVETNNNDSMLRIVGSTDNVGIGGIPASGGGVLQVFSDTPNDETVRFVVDSTIAQKDLYGPIFDLVRTYSDGVGQNGAEAGRIRFRMENDNSDTVTFCDIRSETYDVSAGSEDGVLSFRVITQGADLEYMRITARDAGSPDQKAVVINEVSQDIGFRVESDGLNPAFMVDSAQDACGIGTDPDSGVERLHIKGTGTGTLVRLESTDAGATVAPNMQFLRNSGSPAVSDDIGSIQFVGKDDGGNQTTYSQIFCEIGDESGGTEDGKIHIGASFSGTLQPQMLTVTGFGVGGVPEVVVNEGSGNVDFRVETNSNGNFFLIDGGSDVAGIGAQPSSSGAQLQVALSASFYRETSNTFTANHDITVEQAHGHVLVMDASSGASNTFTLPDVAAIGMHVKLVNLAGSNGMTVAVAGSTSHQINGAGTAGSSSVSTTTKFQTIECHYVATNVWVATEPAVAA